MGSKHCPRCGAAAAVAEVKGSDTRKCPRCRIEMSFVELGSTAMCECEQCLGLWLDVTTFEKLCANREQQSVVLGAASVAPTDSVHETNKVRYVPCPDCAQLMNRINFARCSGVIVDTCKGHGLWFDRDELSRIVEFIRGGGLEAARVREKQEIQEERQRLWQEQMAPDRRSTLHMKHDDDDDRLAGIASVKGLLKFLID